MLRLILGHVLLATTLLGANLLKPDNSVPIDPLPVYASALGARR